MEKNFSDPFRKLKEHMEAVKKMGPNFSKPPAGFPPRPMPLPPPVPGPLVQWLLEDLPPRVFHDLVLKIAARKKLKGYRPEHIPQAEGIKILQNQYEKEPPLRAHVLSVWGGSRQKEREALKLFNLADIQRDSWPVAERFGFPLAVWLLLTSPDGLLRARAGDMIKEAASKPGKMDELLAKAKEKTPGSQNIWGLPEFSHGDDVARMRNELDMVLSERDQWKQLAEEERKKRDRNEADRQSDREEIGKLTKARAAAENDRKSLESRVRELESHLESLPKADSTLHHLQKQVRELERESGLLTEKKDVLEKELASTREKESFLERKNAEQNNALALLKAALQNKGAVEPAVFQGEALLLITPEDPSPYFESAKKLGLTLLVHDGQAKNPAFDRALGRSWRAILWGEETEFNEGVLNTLRSSGKPYLLLPSIGPDNFEKLLTAGSSRFKTSSS
jgi:hypothetical protein